MISSNTLTVGQLVWLRHPPDRWSRTGIVKLVDEDLVLVAHGHGRFPKRLTWFNRDKVCTPAEWSVVLREEKKARDRTRVQA